MAQLDKRLSKYFIDQIQLEPFNDRSPELARKPRNSNASVNKHRRAVLRGHEGTYYGSHNQVE